MEETEGEGEEEEEEGRGRGKGRSALGPLGYGRTAFCCLTDWLLLDWPCFHALHLHCEREELPPHL